MTLKSLAYIGLETARMDEWTAFSTDFLGMQLVDRAQSSRILRMDERSQRFILGRGQSEGRAFLGFECASLHELETLAGRLEKHGTRVTVGTAALASQRQVQALITFHDPQGNSLEACWGPSVATDPFIPGRPISGFCTGPLGMGHAVMHVQNAPQLLPFYREVLGFGLSDYCLEPYPVYFLHLNSRHHSLAMVGSGRSGLHHFMVEMGQLDDVGQAYDLAQLETDRVAYTLGRHSNDFMTSFYARTPSGFFIEYGWGGREIDPETWIPHETVDGPSFWGHDRLALSPELRERFREMRLSAAARGLRTPQDSASHIKNIGDMK
jgi:2,3-dihydroxybiphenyl 1,2-dioxygenase